MNAHYRLKRLSTLLTVVIVAAALSGCGAGRKAYKRGLQAEVRQNHDAALAQYTIALQRDPGNIEYRLKYEQERYAVAFEHFERGRRALSAGKIEEAKAEFSRTLEIDPTHVMATQQLKAVNELLQSRARQQPDPAMKFEQLKENARTDPSVQTQLDPKITGPIDLRITQDSRVAFETLGELAGLNVIFDPDFRGARIPIELDNVGIYEALDILAMQTRTFWKPINRTTIIVAPDNTTKRREYEEMILKTIYLSNSVTSTEITEAITALRTLLNMRFLAQSTAMNAIIVRDTPDRIAIAEKIIEDLDKSKAEVVIEAMVLEVDRNKLRELGILPPGSTALTFTTPGSTASAPNNAVPLRDLEALNTANFSINIPQTIANFLASSSNARLVQNPRVRATDGKQADIRIGSKIPVPSGSFQPAFVGATGTPVVQFQYLDVGVNLIITPRVLLNREISMVVNVQVAALAGDRNVGGAILPVFTNRSITHEIRLVEGETNILGGIISDAELVSLTGIPGLKEIPILKYLFSSERRIRDQTEIIIMLTPHIVRMPDISATNMRGIYTGSEVNPRLRASSAAAPAQPASAPEGIPPSSSGQMPSATQPPAGQTTIPAPAAPAASAGEQPANATLTFAPQPLTLPAGPASVNIGLTGDNIFGVDLTISFDPAMMAIREVREGGFLSRDGQVIAVVQRLDTGTGTARISLERPPGAGPLSGTGDLVTLVIERTGRSGESMLRVTGFRVRDTQQRSQTGRPAEVRVTIP